MKSLFWGGNISVLPERGSSLFINLSAAPKFKAAVEEACAVIQAPFHATVLTALSAVSAATQGSTEILAHYGKKLPLGLAVVVIAESGERKDGLVGYFFDGIERYKKVVQDRNNEELQSYRARHAVWKRRRKSIEKMIDRKLSEGGTVGSEENQLEEIFKDEPLKPVEYFLTIEDATTASIVQQLERAGGTLTILSPEGGNFFKNLNDGMVGVLNSAISGSPINFGRKTSGNTQVLEPKLSCLVMVQPAIIHDYMGRHGVNSRGAGFWARVLICYPQSTQGYRYVVGGVGALECRVAFSERIFDLVKISDQVARSPGKACGLIKLSADAESLIRALAYSVEHEIRVGGRYELARDHASKLMEMILRVAGCLHVFEGCQGDVSREIVEVAVNICFYCSDQFLDLFAGLPQEIQDMELLYQWLMSVLRAGQRYVRRSFVPRFGPNCLRDDRRMQRAIEGLVVAGKISEFTLLSSSSMKGLDLAPVNVFDQMVAIQQLSMPRIYRAGI